MMSIMKMFFEKIKSYLTNLDIKKKFFLIFFIIITIILPSISFLYLTETNRMVFYIITDDILKMVVKNNQMADSKLQLAKEYAFGLIVDTDLNKELNESYYKNSVSELYFIDSNITKIIQKYFLYSKDVYSVNLITDKYVFGTNTNKNYYPSGAFSDSLMFDLAVENMPLFTWIPTYKYSEMFKQEFLDYVNIEYKYIFSAAKVLKYEEGRNAARNYSILVLNFTESFYDSIFLNDSKYGDMGYFIITGDGNIVAHNDESKLCEKINYPWLSTAFANETGYSIIDIDGEEYLICYDKSNVTGWLSVATVKTKSIMKSYYNKIWFITIII
jgi:two-component system sensor histidine kinase YesM